VLGNVFFLHFCPTKQLASRRLRTETVDASIIPQLNIVTRTIKYRVSRLSTNLLVLWLVKGRSCRRLPYFSLIHRSLPFFAVSLTTTPRPCPHSTATSTPSLHPRLPTDIVYRLFLPGSEADRLIFPIYIYLLSDPSSRRGPFQIPPTSRHYTTTHYRYLHLPHT
jgi:hypothetical protein